MTAARPHTDSTDAEDPGVVACRQSGPAGAGRGSDYAVLSREVRRAGLLDRRPGYYLVKIGSNLLLLAAGWTAFALIGRTWWQLLVAVFLAGVFTQTAFLGHDAGHRQISKSKRVNVLLGRLHGDLLVGLNLSWWVSKHNRHHAHPNQVDRDPDIADGALALTPAVARARCGPAAWVARHQAWLFFPMLLLEAFNLHLAGLRALLVQTTGPRTPRLIEASLLTAHLGGYGTALWWVLSPAQAVCFLLIQQGLFGLYMGCSFAPNHKGMPIFTTNHQIDYLRRQVLTARNIRGGRVTDFVFGGLNYQIEHHLFPSMPRPNLRRAQKLVRAHCAQHGVAYYETGILRSYAQVLRHLHRVGGPLRPELEY